MPLNSRNFPLFPGISRFQSHLSNIGGRRNPEGGSERLLGSALYRIAMFDVNGRLSERSSEVFGVAGMFGEVAGGSETYVKSDN